MKLSVIIPCYNEEATIIDTVSQVMAIDVRDLEIIVVDDGSVDETRALLKAKAEPLVQKVIYHPVNSGKGAALNSGFSAATGDVLVVQDADLEYDPRNLPGMLSLIEEGKADVVFLRLWCNPHRVLYFWHYVGNKFLTLLSNMFTNLNLTDMETCYKMFRREVIASIKIEEKRFGVEPEITAKIARGKHRIYEIGISYFGRTYAEGKKIGWKDGFRAVYAILKYNLFRRCDDY